VGGKGNTNKKPIPERSVKGGSSKESEKICHDLGEVELRDGSSACEKMKKKRPARAGEKGGGKKKPYLKCC